MEEGRSAVSGQEGDKKRAAAGLACRSPSAEDYLYPAFIISRLVICCDRARA